MSVTPRFLVVDDEPALRRIGARMLQKGGYECRVASSADEAIRILDSERIDVMLTDVAMPGQDGIQLARFAQARHPEVVVVMVTGRTDEQTVADARRAGAADYVAKPFHPSDLIAAATRAIHLGSRRSHRPVRGDTLPVEAPSIDMDSVFRHLH